MKITQKEITQFQKKILSWYSEYKQDFPWRKTRDPYHILVSEVMLQQTQVSRVIPKFNDWLKRFPTIESLAKAPVSEVLRQWSGLGYNRRALFLKKAAVEIVEKYNGNFPQDEKILRTLPGIGEYTARALLCFAFNKQISVVDTNVRKVILVTFFNGGNLMTEKEIISIAEQLLPVGSAYDWNQALMDYSRTMLGKEKIQIPKQSKFLGSRRYYRGQIIKLLLQKKKIPIDKIGQLIKGDFNKSDMDWLQGLLKELEDEGFVLIKNDFVSLADSY
jgi:A/G-specific adenine glycosylase